MILQVQIFKLVPGDKDDEFESEFFINMANRDAAGKLTKCMMWAAHNGRSVTTFAKGAE